MTFTQSEIMYAILFGVIALLGLIFAFRKYLQGQSQRLTDKYDGQEIPSSMKKYPEANILTSNGIFYRVGLMFSIGLAILVINWTTFEAYFQFEDLPYTSEIEMNTPPVPWHQPPPPPPPPPAPVIEEVNDDDLVDDVEFEMQEFETPVDVLPFEEKKVAPAVIPVIEKEEEEEEIIDVFTVVEDMPSFPGCEDLSTNDERRKCTEQQLLKYIYKNIKYPSIARETSIEGLVVISFVINKKGEVADAKVLKDIGGGCGDEALKVINSMNDLPQNWTPGRQRSQKVNVKYNIPVRFRLQQN